MMTVYLTNKLNIDYAKQHFKLFINNLYESQHIIYVLIETNILMKMNRNTNEPDALDNNL